MRCSTTTLRCETRYGWPGLGRSPTTQRGECRALRCAPTVSTRGRSEPHCSSANWMHLNSPGCPYTTAKGGPASLDDIAAPGTTSDQWPSHGARMTMFPVPSAWPGKARDPTSPNITPQHLFTDTDLGRHMGHRSTRLDHLAGSLLPKLRGVFCDACPTYGHPFRGTCNPTNQVPTISGQTRSSSRSVLIMLPASMPRWFTQSDDQQEQ